MRAKAGGGVENSVATKMPKERRGGGLGNKKKKKKMQLTDITNTRNGARPSKRRKKVGFRLVGCVFTFLVSQGSAEM